MNPHLRFCLEDLRAAGDKVYGLGDIVVPAHKLEVILDQLDKLLSQRGVVPEWVDR